MAIDIQGGPIIVPATFVAQAIDAGLDDTIRSLVGLGMTERDLLVAVKTALVGVNDALVNALTSETLRAVLRYMADTSYSFTLGRDLPDLLDADGPSAIWVAHSITPVEHLTITTPAEEEATRALYKGYHLLIDGQIYSSGALPANPANDIQVAVSLFPGNYQARICYVLSAADLSMTRLSPAEVDGTPVGAFTVE